MARSSYSYTGSNCSYNRETIHVGT